MAKVPAIDLDSCTGCGTCAELAPNTFVLNDDELAEVTNPTGDPEDAIQEAIDNCPVECITWEDE